MRATGTYNDTAMAASDSGFRVLCIQVSALCGPEGLSGSAFSIPPRFLLEPVILFGIARQPSLGMSSALSGFLSIDALSNRCSPRPRVLVCLFCCHRVHTLWAAALLCGCNYHNLTNQYPALHFKLNQPC